MISDARVLVTGGTGFLGSYLIRLLVQKGYTVRATKRPNSPMDLFPPDTHGIEWVNADLNDVFALEDALEGITHVFHCAAIVSFHAKDRANMMKINVEGTANVVNLCLDKGVQKLVHTSSIAALGRAKDRPVLDEESKWVESKGNTQYAISKYLSEMEVWRGQAEGLAVAIVNPAMIFGSGFWDFGTARFFKQIDEGLKFCPVGRTGMVDVRDVALFMLQLMESDIVGQRFVLSAENLYYRELFNMIAQSINKPAPGITVTPLLAELAWRVEWLKSTLTGAVPMVTRESARSSVADYTYRNDKSTAVFNFAYRPIADTIRDTGLQYREAQQAGKRGSFLDFES